MDYPRLFNHPPPTSPSLPRPPTSTSFATLSLILLPSMTSFLVDTVVANLDPAPLDSTPPPPYSPLCPTQPPRTDILAIHPVFQARAAVGITSLTYDSQFKPSPRSILGCVGSQWLDSNLSPYLSMHARSHSHRSIQLRAVVSQFKISPTSCKSPLDHRAVESCCPWHASLIYIDWSSFFQIRLVTPNSELQMLSLNSQSHPLRASYLWTNNLREFFMLGVGWSMTTLAWLHPASNLAMSKRGLNAKIQNVISRLDRASRAQAVRSRLACARQEHDQQRINQSRGAHGDASRGSNICFDVRESDSSSRGFAACGARCESTWALLRRR
ncbi:hypothetical protein B0H13DRAFT_2336744 [Mycena leptocephala]|nr:hypothetical protein B0H13DRAFT_2336744 [Mycena leptocephala]